MIQRMKATHVYLFLHVFLAAGVLVNAFEPITATVVVSVGAALGRTIYNFLHESCDAKWITYNATGEHMQRVNVRIVD